MKKKGLKRKFSQSMLALSILLILTAGSSYALDVHLVARGLDKTMPDSTVVPMWGFAQAANADCPSTVITGGASVPGPRITVPHTDAALNITLCNELSTAVSIVIPGQTAVMTPEMFTDGSGRTRVRSFTHETPGTDGMTYHSQLYTWNNLRPGTYIYHSGTHPQVQVQMGLYGAVTKDFAAGQAYSSTNTTYDSEAIVFLSEIDPELHDVVDGGTYGISMTSTIDYNPKYYLINGEPYSASSVPIPAGNEGGQVLVRFLSAALGTHVPVLHGGLYMNLIAEDGNLYPYPREQYSLVLPALKTRDAIINAPDAGIYTLIDRRLSLTNNAASPGGLQTGLQISAP